MAATKKASPAQLAARAKFTAMVKAKAAAKKTAGNKPAAKKVAGLDKVVRRGKKTSVYYSRVSGINYISLNDIGSELSQLDKDITELGSFIRSEKNATERNNLKLIRKVKQDQFKSLKVYLNTRAKFR